MVNNGTGGSQPSIWALLDDRAGNRSQCLGVAESLGLRFETRDLQYTVAAALPNVVMGASFAGLTAGSRAHLAPSWPDVIVAAGRRTAPVARRIKRLNGGHTFLTQIMYPGAAGAGEFDLIAAPRHDERPGSPGLIHTTGAPHRLTPARLEEAARQWQERLADLPRPRVALAVGGSTRRRRFTGDMARELGRTANDVTADAGGSLLVSTSRRTGEAADTLIGQISVATHVYRWGDSGDNPYLGHLGLADAIIVTGDSVSMCSEACAGTGPVYIYAPDALTITKHARLHKELFEKGYARPWDGTLETWSHPPLNAAGDIAQAVRKRLGL